MLRRSSARQISAGSAFAGGRIYGLAVGPGVLIAVGTEGDLYRGSAAVWTSADGIALDSRDLAGA